jgi:hypothetical protein
MVPGMFAAVLLRITKASTVWTRSANSKHTPARNHRARAQRQPRR